MMSPINYSLKNHICKDLVLNNHQGLDMLLNQITLKSSMFLVSKADFVLI